MNKRNAIRTMLLSIFLVFIGLAPAQAGNQYPDSVSQLVADTKRSIKIVTLEQFKATLDSKSYDMIIDVREADEYVQGHVPGAINIPRGVIEFRIWKHVGFPDNTDTSKKTYLYCASGSRCALATKSLQDLGFSNVIAVDMRYADWLAAGYPVER